VSVTSKPKIFLSMKVCSVLKGLGLKCAGGGGAVRVC
jgi:hypothetical protein